MAVREALRRWPRHGWVGLALVGLFWTLNWSLDGLRTQWAFFPLWLGYCLTVDALTYARKGDSLLARDPRGYVKLFLVSAPAWWLFELLNSRSQNWRYVGREFFTDFQYGALATLSFSTVIPAVFGTAELAGTFGWLRRLRPGPRLIPSSGVLWGFFLAGWAMLAFFLLWPRYFFPFLWLALFFLIEPLNAWFGHPVLLESTAERDWRPVISLWTGVLICAFFWEMWNFGAYPYWVYDVPFVGFLHVFQMPLLGYTGYLPFSLELFALFHLVMSLLRQQQARGYLLLAPGMWEHERSPQHDTTAAPRVRGRDPAGAE